jgi:hypothetical protein
VTSPLRRGLAALAALAVGAATVVAATVAPAGAAVTPTVSIVQAGPYVNNQTVTVKYSGFTPSGGPMGVAAAVCKKLATGAFYTGASDECAPIGSDYVVLGDLDANGAGTLQLKLLQGFMNSTWTCGAGFGHECDVVVVDMANASLQAKTRIVYKATITSLSPTGRYIGGQKVTVRFSGAGASQTNPAVAALICDADVPIGDGSKACNFGSIAPATVDASGNGVATVTIVKGALGNALKSTCANTTGSRCAIVVTDFNGRLLGSSLITYKLNQTLPYFPTSVKKNKLTKLLPRKTSQGKVLKYSNSTPKVCSLVSVKVNGVWRKKVKGLRLGTCSIKATAYGTAVYAPFSKVRKIKVVA